MTCRYCHANFGQDWDAPGNGKGTGMLVHFRSTSGSVFVIHALLSVPLCATIQVALTPSVASPQPVGTKITWTATTVNSNPGPVTYRFEYAPPQSATFSLLRDFSLANTLDWVTIASEGAYRIRVTARDLLANETAQQTAVFALTSRVVGGQAVVNPTSHPLVALFSAPSCPAGSFMRVSYQANGSSLTEYTNWSRCRITSMNIHVAGMRANTTYNMNYQVVTGGVVTPGPAVLPFLTGSIPPGLGLPEATVRVPVGPETETRHKILLIGYVTRPRTGQPCGAAPWPRRTGQEDLSDLIANGVCRSGSEHRCAGQVPDPACGVSPRPALYGP